jgi:hypothetical protein
MKNFLLILFLALGLVSLSQDTKIPIHIEGKVLHPDTETPFKGAVLQLFYKKSMVYSMVTDSSGKYHLPMKKLGEYYIIAKMKGFDNDTISGYHATIREPNVTAMWFNYNFIMDTLDINKQYQIESKKTTQFAPYPNPTNGIVNISRIPETSEILLLNMFGSVLNTIDIEKQKSLTIDLTSFPKGVYFLTYMEDGLLHAKKIMRN